MRINEILVEGKFNLLYSCDKCRRSQVGDSIRFRERCSSTRELIEIIEEKHKTPYAMPLGWSYNGSFMCKECRERRCDDCGELLRLHQPTKDNEWCSPVQAEIKKQELIRTCPTCAEIAKKGGFGPRHEASPRCESGKRDHCTCDTCF